jgi:iron complex outermembrane receptor protein
MKMDVHDVPNHIRQSFIAFLLVGLTVSTPRTAIGGEIDELINLSLEELLQVTVTSVSRKPQSLSTSPAAVFVISQDDIRRSGARTIPDALRMVPGVQVAQVDASTWAVTARGSNGIYANKLLVLMDGRTLYDPLFSGVYWDTQETTLASVERIEVIRGPGAALWGANAVNGVINIITKNAKDTHGLNATVATGTSTKFETNVQWGGEIGNNIDYRVFGKYFSRDGFAEEQDGKIYDDWNMGRIGGRLDWSAGTNDTLTITSEYYEGDVGQNVLRNSLTPPASVSTNIDREPMGVFVNIDWNHTISDTSNFQIRTYYDYREHRGLAPETEQDTYDLDLQHRFRPWSRHDIVWGFGLRNTMDETRGDETITLTPSQRTQRRYSGFIQDEIRVIGDEVFLTLGTKVEKNNFSPANDFEWSPNLRLSWLISDTSTLWGSVARAIRTPSRIEQDAEILGLVDPPGTPTNPNPVPFVLTILGNPEFDNEEVTTYELGYRAQPFQSITVDIALFYNHYKELRRTVSPPMPICQPAGLPVSDPNCFAMGFPDYVELPITFINQAHQDTSGIEIAATYNASEWWRLYGAYSYLNISGDGPDTTDPASVGEDSPEHQLSIRSNMSIGNTINVDIWARYVDELKIQQVDSYVGLDVRLAWEALPSLELSLVGRNLLESSHLEFREESGSNIPVEIDRELTMELLWQF